MPVRWPAQGEVPDNTVETADLKDVSVTEPKLANDAVSARTVVTLGAIAAANVAHAIPAPPLLTEAAARADTNAALDAIGGRINDLRNRLQNAGVIAV